jgi:2-polyprenyl-6-methoxyphenol hydroxylase-like FAD-dependent oxidoreductase
MSERKTEVLVVGAGPTGLLTALMLAEAGIDVQIIDGEERTASRSYACALHGKTIELLDRCGVAEPILQCGRQVHRIAFYDGESRRAETNFAELGGRFPFLLVLPQNMLEKILELRLRERVKVKWNHRFDGFQRQNRDEVVVTVEELEGTALGYIVPHWETVVKRQVAIRTQFVVGADGRNSLVRRRLGIESETSGTPESIVACEFTAGTVSQNEVRVVMDDMTTNVLWPLSDDKYRWTFQLIHSEAPVEFPQKERCSATPGEQVLNKQIRTNLQKLIQHRAPWFSGEINEILWCKQAVFEHRLARSFGRDRCWLAGDAAHQTGPVGVQSLNAGFGEAEALAGILKQILRDEAPLAALENYDRERQNVWRRLLGWTGGLSPNSGHNIWLGRRAARLLSCLPASGDDLSRLAGQLGLEFA